MQPNKKLSPCDFCKHHTPSGCTVTPNYTNCKDAKDEYYARINAQKQQPAKSLRPWERKR